jgi:hypothetical protein
MDRRASLKQVYSNPGLRERIKKRILAGGKGGKPGQWSARKAQMVAQEYKAKGGKYKGGPSSGQKSLKKWTKQDWTTPSGKPSTQGPKASGEVYAPRRAIEKLRSTPGGMAKLAAATAKKREATKEGKQFASHGLHKGADR